LYPQVFGKYVLERELSRGGMARVVLATLRGAGGFEKRLVVKQIRDELAFDQQFVRRFVEEAKTTVALSHPNIVPVYELGVEQGTYFLAMELVEGVSIAELVRERDADGKKRVLSPEEGAYVGMEVCRALDYAHRRMKVVHRDITPRNVMLDEEGQVKLIDFGIAAPARVAGHEILGSPGHMSPEQVAGLELGPPTDIFAVAVLLLEAWTGTPTFRRATPEACDAAMREPHPRPSDFDPRLAPLDEPIARALQLDPRERQQKANELGRALRAFLARTNVDVTDLAHVLGERVRMLREREEEAAQAAPLSVPKKTQPSQLEFGTHTFAAREEGFTWAPETGRTEGVGAESDSGPPLVRSPAAPHTRRLSDSLPPHVVRKVDAPRDGRVAAALSIPTPLMIQTGVTQEAIAAAALAAKQRVAERSGPPAPLVDGASKADASERIETVATRPLELETPIVPMETKGTAPPNGPAAPPASPVRPWRVPALGGAALAVGIALWNMQGLRRGDPGGQGTSIAPSPSPLPSPSATSSVSAPLTAIPSAAIPAPRSTASSPLPPSPASAGPTFAAATAGTVVAGRAQATFLGDPGTRVSIDGASRGACPVRVALDPGAHDVRFVFEPTGESRGERLTVKANEKVTVRADFTGASPTVRIQR
jgi:serine/threonine protein kinase